jgi:Flp pilus assembly protein TadD
LNLGIALARQRRFADAVAQLHDTLRLEPKNRKAQEFLSAIEQRQTQEP